MLECGDSPVPKQEAAAWRGRAGALQSGSVGWGPAWPLTISATLRKLVSLSLGLLIFER